MKRTFAMNIIRKLRGAAASGVLAFAGTVALGLGALLFSACENPFRAGLGAVVDMQHPTVSLIYPTPGSPIRGSREFRGTAWDDMAVQQVQFRISYHQGFSPAKQEYLDNLEEREGAQARREREQELLGWRDVRQPITRLRDGNWSWSFEIDTRMFRDGALHLRLMVMDTAEKITENLDDVVFFVRNDPPVISMDFPRLARGDDPGNLGGGNLNFGFAEDFELLGHVVDPFIGVSGMITDENQLFMGEAEGNRFPPQFRIWEVYEPEAAPPSSPISGIPVLRADKLPPDETGEWRWHPIGHDGRSSYFLPNADATAMLFFYTMPEGSEGRFFAIQIRAQSSVDADAEGRFPETRFPRDEWGDYYWYSVLEDSQRVENSFVAFQVEAPQEPPQLELLRFQDILRQNAWDPGQREYRNFPEMGGAVDVQVDIPHPYLSETANIKSGPFTLRVRASHFLGVDEAVAFWEGGGERGLFIWDTATEHWNPDSNVGTDTPFTMWGYADPNLRNPPTRSFIFTYTDGDNFHDDDAGIHPGARGRYRMQRFRFVDSDWDRLYGNIREQGGWEYLLQSGNWENANAFWNGVEGTFTIRVYTRTTLGVVSAVPLVTTVTIDRQAPVIALSEIVGSAGEGALPTGETYHIVNDVIRPRLSVDDAVSGLRDVERPGGGQTEEIVFVLIDESNRAAIDGLPADFWPLAVGAAIDGAPSLPAGVTAHRHGPVLERSMYIQTRTLTETDPVGLPDGFYRLYVFARDRAFNVARYSILLNVNAESDRPRFYFDMGIDPGVRDPNHSPAIPSEGFFYGGRVRNRLRPADDIRFTIRDDDSLDLGTAAAPSTLRISITASRTEADGRVVAVGSPVYLCEALDVSIVRRILPPPQTVLEGRRLPVREWTGVIPQRYLAEALFGGAHPRLPDGIYRIRMSVSDDPSNKQPMPAGAVNVASRAVSRTEEFWIAVDELSPVIEDATPADGEFIPAITETAITGTVSDDNGPIRFVRFNVTDNAPGGATVNIYPIPDPHLNRDEEDGPWVSLTRTNNTDTWEAGFRAVISMGDFFPLATSGEFTFELVMEDRFGNETETLRRRYLMDNTPPSVTLRTGITTFSRPSVANSVGGLVVTPVNAGRLANKVLSFTVDATDDFAVGGIHWWLLPANTGATEAELVTAPNAAAGRVDSFHAFPSAQPNIPLGGATRIPGPTAMSPSRGAFGRIAPPGGTVYIDTYELRLPDGEYRLHVIAVDGAGNQSIDVTGVTGHVQTIFLLQAEDRPYFVHGIRPDTGDVRGNDLIVTGVIMDDDGFGMGMSPDSGSVTIWVSSQPPFPGMVPSSAILDAPGSGWHRAVPTDGISLIEGTNIVLALDLLALFPEFFEEAGDGEKFYVIRAQDSIANKIGTAAQNVQAVRYSQVFSFMRDVLPPELYITHPVAGQTVMDDTFYLRGSIADANLNRYPDVNGNPYLLWRLNATGSLSRFVLTPDYITDVYTVDGIEIVHFEIPPQRVRQLFDAYLDEGPNTLELRVEDRTGASTETPRNFIRDTLPPTVTLRTGISTFSRPSAAYRIGSGNPIFNSTNADRLANKVLSFAVDATDNIAVGGIHWWLLPASAGSVNSFWSFPAAEANPQDALGIGGAFGRIDPPGGTVYIDTHGLNLPDGEYRLHIIAVDEAGNESLAVGGSLGSLAQTIFLFQAEDRPYFSSIRPSGGEGRRDDLLLTGVIVDDDGFGTGMFADAGSVEIWISTNNNLNLPAGVEPSSAAMTGAGGWVRAVVPQTDLTLIEGSNIVLELNLLDMFPGLFANAGDGEKFFVIRAQDSNASKISPPGVDLNIQAVRYSQVFSFVRDVTPPELEIEHPVSGQIVGDATFYIRGSISDATLSRTLAGNPYLRWRLIGAPWAPSALSRFELTAGYITDRYTTINGIETVHFEIPPASVRGMLAALYPYPVNTDSFADFMDDGHYILELRVEDRARFFDETPISFVIDKRPPTLTLRTGISTFSRPSAAYRMNGGTPSPSQTDRDNAARLANRVLRFAVDATDYVAVGDIHWWLLPAGADSVDSFWAFPAREANPQAALGTGGAFGRISAHDSEAFIDTYGLNLPDGEYRLYIIAVDEAGNESVAVGDRPGALAQTIFLFQAEDRPYFSNISPAGRVALREAVVLTGVIMDDDGFGTGMFPDAGSVEIWISTDNNLPAGVEPSSAAMTNAGGWYRAVVPPQTAGLTLVDGTSITMELINLVELFPAFFAAAGDGEKFYVIRAQDSHVNKWTASGEAAPDTDRVHTYSQVFSFIRDIHPPELHLASPVANQVFRNDDFRVVGQITDAHLSRTDDGYAYLRWRLNGSPLNQFRLTGAYANDYLDRVEFDIPFSSMLAYSGISFQNGSNTLELRVEDLTGAFAEIPRSFIIDTIPPNVALRPGMEIRTFSRPSAAYRMNGGTPSPSQADRDNAARLANMDLRFAVDTTDNVAVGDIHWWLLPASADYVDYFWAFPASEANPQAALGTGGAFGRVPASDAGDGVVVINTSGLNLPDGEYRLHVIAVDQAGNESIARPGATSYMQTVFLFQAEDRPYFATGISLAGDGTVTITEDGESREIPIRSNALILTGIIADDDGFGTGMFAREGSVDVWISTGDLPDDVEPSSAILNAPGSGWVRATVPPIELNLVDGTNIVLNLNLTSLAGFGSFFDDEGDGIKHLVIRAEDQYGAASYYGTFSFMRDVSPPELVLAHPASEQTFTNAELRLVGYIADFNLSRTGGYPYLEWRLIGPSAPSGSFSTLSLSPFITGAATTGGLETIHFEIPNVASGLFNLPGDSAGGYTLELRVRDIPGAITEMSRGFVMDNVRPDIGLNITEVPLRDDAAVDPRPDDAFFAWWWNEPQTDDARLEWNTERREWAEADNHALSIIEPEGRIAWLSGSFTDAVSDIDPSSARFWINNELVPRGYFRHEGLGRTVNWRIPLTVDGDPEGDPLPGGVHTVSVQVADRAGNVRARGNTYVFRLDGDVPQVRIASQEDAPSVFSSAPFTVQGTASDANLRRVKLSIYRQGETTPVTGLNSRDLVSSADDADWSYNYRVYYDGLLDRVDPLRLNWRFEITQDIFDSLDDEGVFEVRVVATDWRDEMSELAIWQFTKDTSSPTFSFIGRAAYAGPNDLSPYTFTDEHPSFNLIPSGNIQATISDAFSDIYNMQGLLERWTWDGDSDGGWDAVTLPGATTVGWTDLTGFGGSPRNHTWSMPVGGLPEGLYRLRLRAMDSSYFAGHATADFADNSRGNPDESDWLYFYRDVSPPTVEFGLPLTMSSRFGTNADADTGTPGVLSFTVTAFDYTAGIGDSPGTGNSLGLRSLTATVRNAAGTVIGAPETVSVFEEKPHTQRDFPLTLAVPYDAEGGIHTITIVARDLAGRETSVSNSFTLDNSPPVGSFQRQAGLEHLFAGVGNLLAGSEWEISGDAIDPASVVRMDFRIGRLGDASDNAVPTAAALAAAYLTGAENTVNRDTSRNNDIFETGIRTTGAARTWFPLRLASDPDTTVEQHQFFSIQSADSFDWRLGVTESRELVNWLLLPANEHLIARVSVDGIDMIDLPIWFRAVDGEGNAGYFGQTFRINPYADMPSLRIDTPSARAADFGHQRGGRVDLGGFAQIEADVPVHSVLYRVFVGGRASGTGDIRDPLNSQRPGHPVTTLAGAAPPVTDEENDFLTDPEGANIQGGGWLRASIPTGVEGSNVPWNFNLNAGREIAALIEEHGFLAATGAPAVNPAVNDTIRVWVEIIALNGTDVGTSSASSLEVVSFYLRDSAPQILYATVTSGGNTVTYWDGNPQWDDETLPHRGRFTITAILDAASGQTLSDVRIIRPDESPADRGATDAWVNPVTGATSSGNILSGVTVTPITLDDFADAPGTAGLVWSAGRFWRLVYRLDPALAPATTYGAIRGGDMRYTGGEFRVEMRIRDNSPTRVENTLTLPILLDNFAPVVDTGHVTNPTQAGSSGQFIGRTLDFSTAFGGGNPANVSRIYAWFERDGQFIAIDELATGALDGGNLRRENRPTADVAASGNAPGRRTWEGVRVGRTATVNGMSVNVTAEGTPSTTANATVVSPTIAANAATAGGGAWVRVISGPRDAAERGTGRRDAISWDAREGGRYVEWSFNIDTTRLPDGPLALNYIVVDHVGNASFHQQHVVIMNNFPEISRIIMHTSNTDTHTVTGVDTGDFEPGTYRALDDIFAAQRARAEGFIDSGFTARNRFIGFTVETHGGNAPLHYRLQHVTRTRVPLNAAALTAMFNDIAGNTGVDMFTIADTGNVTHDTWRRLGVHANRTPAPGMHVAFRPVDPAGRSLRVGTGEGEVDVATAIARFALGVPGTAAIYRYTAHRSAEVGPLGAAGDAVNPSVDPNNFSFAGANFGGSVTAPDLTATPGAPAIPGNTTPMRIPQFISRGSLATHDDPVDANRPFFLIRVWDSVIAGADGSVSGIIDTGPRSNYRLHDAVVIASDIFIADDLPPTVRFHDLNPGFERSVEGNNLTGDDLARTMSAALNPRVGNAGRGGIFNIGTEREPRISGYIDPGFAIGGGVNRDQVSGQVILRGRAYDNQRIGSIELSIVQGNTPDWFTILEWPETGGTGLVPVRNPAHLANTIRPAEDPDDPLAWRRTVAGAPVFTDVGVYQTLDWEEGHDVEWSFRWNTETFTATHGPASNVVISVRITDAGGRPVVQTHTVDIVPYITGFERQSRYANIRSMQGWHSFYQGETGISALGFNLGTAAPEVDGPITNASEVSVRRTLLSGLELRGFTFDVPANATSGRIDVEVTPPGGSATPIHNHISDHTQLWNSENFRADGRSELWTNRPHAHIWRTRADGNMPRTFMGLPGSSTNLDHPGMALQYVTNATAGTNPHSAGNLGDIPLGTLHGVWSVYGNAMVHYGRNDGTGINPTADRTRIADGTPGDPVVQPDIGLFRGGGIPNLVYIHHADGNPAVFFHSRPDQRSGAPPTVANATNTPSVSLIAGVTQTTTSTSVTERWRNIRTVTAAGNPGTLSANPNTGINNTNAATNPGRLFTTVYDALNRRLVFALRDGTADVTTVFIDGNGANITGAGSAPASTNAGLFSAVGYDITAAGLTFPIVAYYDFTHDTIRIAFANAQVPAAANWRRDNVLTPRTIGGVTEAQHPLFIGSGSYVSMVVDRLGTIHLAFFNSRHQALVYAYAPRPAAGHTGQSRTFNAMIVDTLPGVGTWTDISVDHWGNPFIVYGYQGRDDNFDGVRMAFRSGGRGPGHTAANAAGDPAGIAFGRPLNCRVTGASISGWEAVSMAAPFRVSYDRLNIEAWPPSNRANPTGAAAAQMGTTPATSGVWNAAIGYVGDRYFRIGYFFRPPTISGGWLGGNQN